MSTRSLTKASSLQQLKPTKEGMLGVLLEIWHIINILNFESGEVGLLTCSILCLHPALCLLLSKNVGYFHVCPISQLVAKCAWQHVCSIFS